MKAARYYPEGRRGCDEGRRSSGHGMLESAAGYFARPNREILVAVWIEEVEGMNNLDEILEVPGVDAVHFGYGDLALSMAYSGHPDRPAARESLPEGRRKAVASDKALIGEPADAAKAKKMIEVRTRGTEDVSQGLCLSPLGTTRLPVH